MVGVVLGREMYVIMEFFFGVGERLVCLLLVTSILDQYSLSLAIVVFVFGCFECRCHNSYWLHYPSRSNAFKFVFWILVG